MYIYIKKSGEYYCLYRIFVLFLINKYFKVRREVQLITGVHFVNFFHFREIRHSVALIQILLNCIKI